MKYLSFDIECCDGVHICEFGYVVFDSGYNVLERDNILINPEHKFRLTGRPHEDDLYLHYTEQEYNNSPIFSNVYPKIKDILENPDYTILGFSLKNDVKFLATACARCGEKPIQFSYYDFQGLYKAYTQSKNKPSVEKFVNELGITDITLHKSDEDAYAVVLGLKAIGEKENKNLEDTLNYLLKLNKSFKKTIAKTKKESIIKKVLAGSVKVQNKYIKNFIAKLQKEHCSALNSATICMGGNFQRNHFNEFLALVEIIYRKGDTYTGKASECDVFIRYDYCLEGEIQNDLRLDAAKGASQEGKQIRMLPLSDYLKELGVTEKGLSERNVLRVRDNSFVFQQRLYHFGDDSAVTISDILAAKGVSLPDS